ncbi:hypothetical protein HGM15179_011299 [Zosterops borbonicus]|uniref:Uncharacterized protein n=1 Tax=Zosterops borbonicus TaxID=364589 RepID=A0A8K1LIX3_9PASS|nr:hypothetical protein HGM15179_011299 [Zosterops borbonicus]
MGEVLRVGSHQSGVEGQNPFPQPAGHATFDAAQDAFGFLNNKCTLLAHVELLMNQHTQILLLRAALNPFSTQPEGVLGIFPIHMQDSDFVELHEVHTSLSLKAAKVPLVAIPFLWSVDHTTQMGIVGKLAVGALPLSMPPTKIMESASPRVIPQGRTFFIYLHWDIKPLTSSL